MSIRLMLSSFAVLVGMGSVAHADIYAAGPLYGGDPTGGAAVCRIINVGTVAVNITLRQIITNTNVVLANATDTCGAALAAGANCAYSANVAGNFALSCRAFVQGNDPQISGSMDIQRPVGTVRAQTPMQNTNN